MRFPVILFLLIALVSTTYAQPTIILSHQPEQDACGAIPICGNFSVPYFYRGHGNSVQTSACIDESWGNNVWLKFKVISPGTLVFAITPVNPINDFGFLIYKNPICNAVYANPPVRCNNVRATGSTGLSISPLASPTPDVCHPFPPWPMVYPFSDSIQASSGDSFLLMINFDEYLCDNNTNNLFADGFSIDFSGSTAVLGSTSHPHYLSFNNSCNKSQEITINMSEPIKCNSIAPNGSDFYITPPLATVTGAYAFDCAQIGLSLAYPRKITAQFSNPLPPGNYWLHAQSGTDGNTLLSLCDAEQLLPDSIAFTVEPYTSIQFTGIHQPACQSIVVGLSHKIRCDSVASDGSDFIVSGPSTIQVVSALPANCDLNGFADTVQVMLQSPISVQGTYHLRSQRGTDHNTLVDSCTAQMLPGTQIAFTINPYDNILDARPDTILCKPDSIRLMSTDISIPDAGCGIDTADAGFSVTRTTPGAILSSGATGYTDPGFFWWPYQTSTPFGFSRKGQRVQMLILASELEQMGFRPGVITKIGWTANAFLQDLYYPFLVPAQPWWWNAPRVTYDQVTIKLGCTNISNLQTQGPPLEAGQQIVYETTNYYPPLGLNEFVLDHPYRWDGFTNLLVEVCTSTNPDSLKFLAFTPPFWDTTYTWKYPLFVNIAQTGFNSFHLFGSDTSDGCSIDNSNLAQNNRYRPVTRITMSSFPSVGAPYQWLPIGSIVGDNKSPEVTAFITASTSFSVSVVDRFGCYLTDTVAALVSELAPTVTPSDSTICEGVQLPLIADGGPTQVSYNWLTDQPLTLSCLDCKAALSTPTQNVDYAVVISDNYGCIDTLPVSIHVSPLPHVVASPSDTMINYGESLQLSAEGAYLYSWEPFSSLTGSVNPDPVASPLEPTDYVVIGWTEFGCSSSDTIHVEVDCHDHIFVPSAFSPDGDGKNDLFHVVNLTFQKIQEFRVFNRWGQEVFSATDDRGWDGTFNGAMQDIGTYQYLIRVGYPDGQSKLFKGSVSLIH